MSDEVKDFTRLIMIDLCKRHPDYVWKVKCVPHGVSFVGRGKLGTVRDGVSFVEIEHIKFLGQLRVQLCDSISDLVFELEGSQEKSN